MKLPAVWKKRVAHWVKNPLIHRLMVIGIRVVVPKHRMGVAIVPMNNAGEVLLLRHVFHPTAPWGIPGGWLDRNEDPAQGVLRELKEETGLTGQLGPVLHTEYDPSPPHIGIAYLGYVERKPISLSGEIIEANWFTLDNLPVPLLPFVSNAIHKAYEIARI